MSIDRREFMGMGLALAGASLAGCAGPQMGGDGWVRLIDGRSIPAGWGRIDQQGSWSVVEGTLQGVGSARAPISLRI